MKDEEAPDEPQLIMNNSKIWLNNERMEMIDGHWSRKQFKRQYNKKLKDRPTEDVWLEFFRCSSSETFHQLLTNIYETIPEEPGLKSFRINGCWDSNALDLVYILQFAEKAANCQKLAIETFWGYRVPQQTRNNWLELAEAICQKSKCLTELTIKNTATTEAQGRAFLIALANSEVSTLKQIDFSGGLQVNVETNKKEALKVKWFDEQQEAVDSLLLTLARQTQLEKLTMHHCDLTLNQQAQVRQILAGRECEIDFGTDDTTDQAAAEKKKQEEAAAAEAAAAKEKSTVTVKEAPTES